MSHGLASRIGATLAHQENGLFFAVTLMEHLVVPTFVLDAEHKVIIWNRACERLTGVMAEEVVGTRQHWLAFYNEARPCLADLVASAEYEKIAQLYSVHENPAQPSFGVHAENWCVMPRLGQRRYLVVDAGPVYDEAGHLIAVVETLRDGTEKHLAETKVLEQASILKAHFDEHQREAELARRILDYQIRSDLMQQAGVKYSVIPATQFSGDMVLAARAPNGKLYAILADATGHGLAAAVSVLPMVQEFYRLVELAQPLMSLIESINFLLANSLPLGRFVAAAFVCLDESVQQGEVWVGGMPDVLMINDSGAVVQRFSSRNLPLGVSRDSANLVRPELFTWDTSRQLLLLSDGAVEATDPAGEQFGELRVAAAVASHFSSDSLVAALNEALSIHLQGATAHDDMSVLVIDCPVSA